MRRRAVSFVQNLLQKRSFVLTRPMGFLGRARRFDVVDYADYVRLSSLELVASEISQSQIPGAVAELGVFRGDFAAKINEAFPDRTFYLFDTFEGFAERDANEDRAAGFSTGSQDFSQTSPEFVLSRMVSPDNCVVRPGWFPDSAADVEDRFVFVSLDADLYSPTYAGLQFFFPRLSPGGFIFVHDYNNVNYSGVRAALQTFREEESVSWFPLSDENGTAILVK